MPGQIFCVIFAIFGIPLNMVVLNQVGKYMLAIERNFCTMIAKKTNHQVNPQSIHNIVIV